MEVSICITAFNIEQYISQALDSVLGQKVSFTYEIIVGEDKSSDNTLHILNDFRNRHPDKFRIIEHQNNLGIMLNLIRTLEACRGKYIAILDGDDYWTDDQKLQKQYDFLECNPAFSLCWHDAAIVDHSGKVLSTYTQKYKGRNYEEDIDLWRVIRWKVLGATSSIMFRNIIKPYPGWGKKLAGPEPFIFLLCRQKGRLYYFDRIMSAYRKHAASMESKLAVIRKTERNMVEEYTLMKVLYPMFRMYFLKKIILYRLYLGYKELIRLGLQNFFRHGFSLVKLVPAYLWYCVRDNKNSSHV
jgi:glycosyltransferase involved in cell wall biosynthesis